MKRELDKLNNKYQGEEFDRLYDDYLYYKNEEGNFTGSFEDFIKARRKAGSLDAEMIRLKEQEDIDKAIEQEDILLDFDPKGRKPNAFGGFNRVGYAEGPENPKKKKGIIKAIKKIPRLGKLVGGLETIMSKFGPDAIGTLEDFYKKGKLKLDPNVKKYQDDKKAVFDFQKRQLDKTEADANREMRKGKFTAAEVLLQRLKNTLKNEKDPYVQETFPNFIKEIEANPKLAEDPKVQEAFGLRDLPENQRLVEYDDGTFDFYTQGSKKGMGSVKALADEFGISMEEAMKIKTMEPEDQILEIERRRALNKRKLNAEGGLNYLMGM
jgi:soluble cytochrome b562